MELIGKTSARILIIVDKNKRLIGTLTDGDIRRAIIDNVDMESPVSKVMRKDPVSANYNSSKNELISLMSDKNLLAIPIVDETNPETKPSKILGIKLKFTFNLSVLSLMFNK